MPFPVGAVANYILELADRDGVKLSPLKLQKLVYLAHGYHLALTDEPLLDEVVEAWKYGPVINSLYHEFKHFGASPIARERSTKLVRKPGGRYRLVEHKLPRDDGEAARAVINRVWEVYRRFSALQLSHLTHEEGGPWAQTWNAMPVKRKGKDIEDEDIKRHFKLKLRDSDS